jgi:hypothetical protein
VLERLKNRYLIRPLKKALRELYEAHNIRETKVFEIKILCDSKGFILVCDDKEVYRHAKELGHE